jgi:hypothetical protein
MISTSSFVEMSAFIVGTSKGETTAFSGVKAKVRPYFQALAACSSDGV